MVLGLGLQAADTLPDHCSSRLREAAFSQPQQGPHIGQSRSGSLSNKQISEETIMRTLVSALIALSVLAGVAAPASAFDAKSFYDQQERQSGN